MIRQLGPGLHVVDAPQRFLGLEIGSRMTVLQLDGGLLVHSPVAVDPAILEPLGEPRWVLAPNTFHHLHAGPWLDAGLEGWAARGLPAKRPDLAFEGEIEAGASPFGTQVELFPLTCFPLTNEIVVLHRPSRTLIVTDLLFNFPRTAPLATRAAMTMALAHPGCRSSVLERIGFARAAARRELAEIGARDFDRVVLPHGDVVETGGRQALRDAYRWLG